MATDYDMTLGDYQVATLITGGNWKQNCYLIAHVPSGEQTVIDPGDDGDRIVETLLARGGDVSHVLLTHAHHDHLGAAAAVCRRFGLDCMFHEADTRLFRHAPMYGLRFAGKRLDLPSGIRTYREGPDLTLGSQSIEVIPTPGHTGGSVCYRLGGLLFSGDTLLYRQAGRTDLPGGDAGQIRQSIERLLASVVEHAWVLPGHGRTWTIREARAWWQSESCAESVCTQMVASLEKSGV